MAYTLGMEENYPLSSIVLNKYAPKTWTPMSPSKTVELVYLQSDSLEYLKVFHRVRSTIPRIQVQKIVRVQNPYLWGVYMLKKSENPNVPEISLYHAVEQDRVPFITANNFEFNDSLTKQGVRFGRSAEHAERCSDFSRTSKRAMIVARVLDTPPSVPLEVPFHLRRDRTTYLKEDYNEYYPHYVLYYYT